MNLKSMARDIWTRLNPADPSPMYLMKLMAFMLLAFFLGLVLG